MRFSSPIQKIARERFGLEQLRPGQEEAIAAVVDGRDTLAVMSTGYGKSAIYQIAAQLIDGPTVVVSPLIALQREQVADLDRDAVGGAAAVSSQESASEREEALEDAQDDELEFLFMTPEQLSNEEVLEEVRQAQPSLLVVDEAHCISEWGHDFRPDYLKLGSVVEALGRPRVLALTATASPPVRDEIVARLRMDDPFVLVRGFNRENIWLGVERFHEEKTKRRALLERTVEAEKPGIVYTATRKYAEDVAAELAELGVNARAYHAGLGMKPRNEVQEAFMDGDIDVIVATTAFGMGVDKPDVRFVFHHDVADSVDSYYQEIGRAGRDGKPARAILFYRPEDLGIRRFFAGSGKVDRQQIEQVAEALDDSDGAVSPSDLKEDTELSDSKILTAIGRLEEVGVVEVTATGDVEVTGGGNIDAEEIDDAYQDQENREAFDRSRVNMIQGYAELDDDCRRGYILNYFGESFDPPCGYCVNCDAGRVAAHGARPFAQQSRVLHTKWGEGTVQRYEADQMVVLFDTVGYKTLGVDLVVERGLLEAVAA